MFTAPPAQIAPTSIADVDAAVGRVAKTKDAWLQVGLARRIDLLEACMRGVADVADAWARDGSRRKGVDPESSLAGEEWLAGPMTTMRNLRLLVEALKHDGQPPVAGKRRRDDGQEVVRVFPATTFDKLMFGGVTADVWIEKGKPASQGAAYRNKRKEGKVSLVLGAGNVSSIPPMDFLYKLFVEDEVVVLKMNPVNADAGPHLELAFRPLIALDFLAIVYGGADVGAHLSNHPQIDTLHVTGSDRTYDAIVWGADPAEQKRRKASGERLNHRPFTAELGCVTPVMVVPGDWTQADLEFQARHIAGMVTQNASFNCNAAKVLVVAEGWPQRRAFLDCVHAELAKVPARKAYYPGADDRYKGFLEHYPSARVLGEEADGVVPWTVIPEVSTDAGEYALTHEAFCGVLAEVSLPATGAEDFLEQAVAFANDKCWGTLSCTVLLDDGTQKAHAHAVDRAVAELRYGGIGINCWPGVIYGLVSPTWGAYPGHTPEDIQSGTGVVHNGLLLDHPEKSVVRAPFRMRPTPAWFPNHRNLKELASRLVAMEEAPSWLRLPPVVLAALKG